MDISLRGYLERQSTEELRAILNYLVNNYEYAHEEGVRMVIAILEEREKDIQPAVTPEIQAAWKHYLNKRGNY